MLDQSLDQSSHERSPATTDQDAAMTGTPPGPTTHEEPNFRYWREHGAGWAAEYTRRKKQQVLYHIQEIMLTEYIAHRAPARVLEFGCGPGRHLRNLRRIEGVDVYGFDQSATMVSGCATWADHAWIKDHITVGEPVGRLPFDDGAFDIVYSAEVLVHVSPEHLPGVLKELLRIARREVFHLETSPGYNLVGQEHGGCWYHDLPAAYEKLGRACEVLPRGYEVHTPYRVILDESAEAWSWSPLFLAQCRKMEEDLQPTIWSTMAAADEAMRRAAGAEAAAADATARVAALTDDMSARTRDFESRLGEATAAVEAAQRAAGEAQAMIANLQQQLAAEQAGAAALRQECQAARASAEHAVRMWVATQQRLDQYLHRSEQALRRIESLQKR